MTIASRCRSLNGPAVRIKQKSPNALTKKLLRLCKEAGYRFVAIGVHDPKNRQCRDWARSWGPLVGHWRNDIFSSPYKESAIWGIVEKCGLKKHCCNVEQAQLHDDSMAKLTPGGYRVDGDVPVRTTP